VDQPLQFELRLGAAASSALIAVLCLAGCGNSAGPGPPRATGSLDVAGCTIAEGAASCPASIAWTTAGASAPRLVSGGATLSTAPAGRLSVAVTTTAQAVTLFDGDLPLDQDSVRGACVSASAWDGGQCRAYAERLDARAPTPFVEDGRPITLEVVVFRPFGPGPFPAVTFHHGSTGNGNDPSLFRLTYTSETVAQFLTERGYLVAFPQRRGRGQSEGLYDEGFTPDRSAYSCLQGPALAGFERALQDVEVAVDWVSGRSDVLASRMLSGGVSRGGILAVAHAGLRPERFTGVVNFVGGWLGEGCSDAAVVNRSGFLRGAEYDRPTLWLYGDNDSFYSLAHSRRNFDAFVAAGGQGSFLTYTRAPGLNGHLIINDPALWTADLDDYLRELTR
jgi:dienelactone hydrolase